MYQWFALSICWEYSIYKYTTLFLSIHLLMEGYFQFEIIKNKGAINILKQVIL